jgi:hypothetical protein
MRVTLNKAQRDLKDATDALSHVWVADDHAAIGHLTNATEALMRAIASVKLVVEQLTEVQP